VSGRRAEDATECCGDAVAAPLVGQLVRDAPVMMTTVEEDN
jgi:hypothetical protein